MSHNESGLSGDLTEVAETVVHEAEPAAVPMAKPLSNNPSAVAAPTAPVDGELEDDGDLAEDGEFEEITPGNTTSILRGFGAVAASMTFHFVGLVALGMVALPAEAGKEIQTIIADALQEKEEELQEIKLEEQLEAATEMSVAVFSSAPLVGAQGAEGGAPSSEMSLDKKVVEKFAAGEIHIESPTMALPSTSKLIHEVPEGTLGDPRAIVDNYDQAFDRITQEIIWMLDKSDVLVIWAFDQSESMKDDQGQIRDRIEKVYKELGLTTAATGDHLLTAVTSYGSGDMKHTAKPTSELSEIRRAINSVPVDHSGKEMMCQAVGRAVAAHASYSKRYQMMLFLVTDESGDRANNEAYLERAINEAKAARCKIYSLGREAVFGYPYVHMRWVHPQTTRVHWLPVDRGPETGFVEQLQTDGFRRRYDAFPAGFAPYELGRMTRETGGAFFMLPSLESALVRGEKRRYELDQMKAYRPDLRARVEVIADREEHPLRAFLWKVVYDLNPYNKMSARVVEMRMRFSKSPVEFVKQARQEQVKAKAFITYLGAAQKTLEEAKPHREQEADPRWQANYDLMYAQVIAYQARLYEYGVALEEFIKEPKVVPLTKKPNLNLVFWDIITNKKVRTDEAKPFIAQSTYLLQEVMEKHHGTPWAGRAQKELARGFGVDLRAEYRRPYPKLKPGVKLQPIPKL